MKKAQIQFPRYFINKPRHEAIPIMETYVNEHFEEFVDGEEITIRYKGTDGKTHSVNAVVEFPTDMGDAYRISVEIGEVDTLKIIQSGGTEGITDKKSLWLSDNWDDEVSENFPSDNIRNTVKDMSQRLLYLEECLSALTVTKTLGGGDIIAQSKKNELENEYNPLMPEDATYPYTTGSTIIENWDVRIGGSSISTFAEGGLYIFEDYYLKPYATNISGEPIDPSAITLTAVIASGEAAITGNNVLRAETSGYSEIRYFIRDNNHPDWTAETRTQLVTFEKNEKPNYNTFNVEHLLVKSVETKQLLEDNFAYILVGEFVWCIEENALYLKEKAKNGTIQLFKINGQGSITPTGETETITYVIGDDGTLSADASEGSVNIDEDGFLNFIGELTDDGILILNDSEIGPSPGPTPTPTGDTSITATIDRDGTLNIESTNGAALVDRDGTFIISATVDKDGNLDIDDFEK